MVGLGVDLTVLITVDGLGRGVAVSATGASFGMVTNFAAAAMVVMVVVVACGVVVVGVVGVVIANNLAVGGLLG